MWAFLTGDILTELGKKFGFLTAFGEYFDHKTGILTGLQSKYRLINCDPTEFGRNFGQNT